MCDLISIVVPVYNVEKFIVKCLDSIIHQTYRNLQIILVDDGSSDHSGAICDQYQNKDVRIQVVHQQNKGVSNARNVGLSLVKGKYVAFCDADDWLEPDMYEYLHGLLQNTDCNIASCGAWMESSENKTAIGYATKQLHLNVKDAIAALHVRSQLNGWMCTKLFETAVVQNLFFDEDLKVCEDYIFQCDAIEKSRGVVCGTETKYHYIQRKSSVSNNGYTQEFEKGLIATKQYIDRYIQLYPDKKRDLMAKYMLDIMGVLTAMIKGNCIDDIRVKEIRKCIRKNIWGYLFTKGPELFLKGSAVVICLNLRVFIFVYQSLKKFE